MKKLLFTTIFTITAFVSNAQTLVTDLWPGAANSRPTTKHIFKDKLIFSAETPNNGSQYYIYNDTVVSKFYHKPSGNGAGYFAYGNTMVEVNGKLYFGGNNDTFGNELRMWDGVNPPVLVKDINTGSAYSEPIRFISCNNKVYFVAYTPLDEHEVWMHDPATLVTRKISNTASLGSKPNAPYNLTTFNNKIYFTALSISGVYNMYVYDPISDTVGIAPYFDAASGGLEPDIFTVCYDKLYFTSFTYSYGRELYVYDGKSAPKRLTDINPGSAHSLDHMLGNLGYAPPFIIGYKGSVYFTAASSSTSGYQLYKLDTNDNAGPVFVYKINTLNSTASEFIEFNGKLYFSGDDGIHGTELWMYDGVNNPTMVADINVGKAYSEPSKFAVYKDNLYFSAYTLTTGHELFKLDKFKVNVENTSMVNNIQVCPVPVANTLYFKMELKTNCAFSITLSDIAGREVVNSGKLTYTGSSVSIPINVLHLTGGTYYYRICTTDGVMLTSGKVVKD